MISLKRGQHGFTLIELMLSTAIFTMMMGGLVTALLAGRSAWALNENVAAASREVRNGLWTMSRDLRQARSVSVIQDQSYMMCDFVHPVDGDVSYMWSDTSREVYRTSMAGTRVVARDISEVTVADQGDSARIGMTAQKTSDTGETTSLTLQEKVFYR